MRHYCTLFDSKYLAQGLVLYESLLKHSSEPFTLNVLPLDQECEHALIRLQSTASLVVLGYRAFENDQRLSDIKKQRTHQEYAWTCASNLCEWLLFCADCELEEITYLDADCYFFSDPKVIFDEIGDRSIAVIPHRLIPSKKHLEINGKFNVSWVTFKNDPIGRECLKTWAWQCREKCSATDGCGDQKYLDAWPDKYGHELCIIQNIGAGLAPWNLANYHHLGPDREGYIALLRNYGSSVIDLDKIFQPIKVIFYHYHEFRENADGSIRLTNYELRPEDIRLIYEPYIEAYKAAKERIATVHV